MAANTVEPLEEIVDAMKEQMRTNHIHRSLKAMKLDSQYYRETYNAYSEKYLKKNEIE